MGAHVLITADNLAILLFYRCPLPFCSFSAPVISTPLISIISPPIILIFISFTSTIHLL